MTRPSTSLEFLRDVLAYAEAHEVRFCAGKELYSIFLTDALDHVAAEHFGNTCCFVHPWEIDMAVPGARLLADARLAVVNFAEEYDSFFIMLNGVGLVCGERTVSVLRSAIKRLEKYSP